MLSLNDKRWSDLEGGYRTQFDPRALLSALETEKDTKAAWHALWGELHHQGDVGEASYAAVPHLVRIYAARGVPDWNTYALIAIIEDARHRGRNPALPENLRDAYEAAWRRLVEIGLRELGAAEDPTLVSGIISVVAMGKGQPMLGRFALELSEEERKDILAQTGWA